MAEGALLLSGVQAFIGIKDAQNQARAVQEQAAYQKKILDINTKLANHQAKDAIARGEEEVGVQQRKVQKLVGAQTAAIAGKGISVSSGIAQKITEETDMLGAMDAVKIRNNAWREAYGYKVEALKNGMQSELITKAAKNNSRNTLVTGGLQAIGSIGSGVANYLK